MVARAYFGCGRARLAGAQSEHHVHRLNAETRELMPLAHCCGRDDPELCKVDVPIEVPTTSFCLDMPRYA